MPETQIETVEKTEIVLPDTATALSRSSLSHPLYVGALLLLVLNDHLLKHVERLPELLTGKLSDFAGLIVAPILLVSLTRARNTLARASCFLIVALVFGAINLSAEAALLFERLTALVGVPWSIVVDPADLIGFAVYPLAWSIARDGAPVRHAFDRATLAAAAIACAASSPTEVWSTSSYAIN